MPLFTFGHGTADRDRLLELLNTAGILELVDVRTAPGSRRNPDVARDEMARWLPDHGIGYRWEQRLGGVVALSSPDDRGLRGAECAPAGGPSHA